MRAGVSWCSSPRGPLSRRLDERGQLADGPVLEQVHERDLASARGDDFRAAGRRPGRRAASGRRGRRSRQRRRPGPARAPSPRPPRSPLRAASPAGRIRPAGPAAPRRARAACARSTLPCDFSGSSSSQTNRPGIMYSGSRSPSRVRSSLRGLLAADLGDQVRDQPVLAQLDDGVRDPGLVGEHRLDLRQLHPVAADLHLGSRRPRKLRSPAGSQRPRSPVRYMRAPGSPYGSGRNLLGRQAGAAEVAAGEPVAAEVDLAGHAGRDRPQVLVQHVDPGSGQRPADRQVQRPFLLAAVTAYVEMPTVASVGP